MKMLVVINPNSRHAKNEQIRETICRKLAPHIVHLIEQATLEQALDEVRAVVASGEVDVVVAVGGDGTVNAIVNEIVGTPIALGIIPTGTANDLANLYGIPLDIESACVAILQGRFCPADLISVNGWCYATAGGLGMASDVCHRANQLKQNVIWGPLLLAILGSKIYILAVVLCLLGRDSHRHRVNVLHNGIRTVMDSLFLMIGNQHFLGKHFQMTPHAKNNDGRFDVCLIESLRNRLGILTILIQVLNGSHVASPSAHLWQGSTLTIQTLAPMAFFGDGEARPPATRFSIRLVPLALTLIVPN